MSNHDTEMLPNSRHCFVCGMENEFGLKLRFYKQDTDTVACDHTVPERYQGYPGVVHGGIVASMLDEIVGRVFMLDDRERFMYTARLTVRYRKHVPVGKPLHLQGRVVKDRGKMAEAIGELYGPEGNLLAEAEALLVGLPESELAYADLEELGWKVYPDMEEAR